MFTDEFGDDHYEYFESLLEELQERLRRDDLNPDTKVSCPREACESIIKLSTVPLHMKDVHKIKNVRVPCPRCNKQVRNLSLHLESCASDGIKRFSCNMPGCKSAFINKNSLNAHNIHLHKGIPIECPFEECKKLLRPGNLNKHIDQAHIKTEKSLCNHCGNQFRHLKPHLERCLSDGVKRLPCPVEGCKGLFLTKHDLYVHESMVHAPPIKCPRKDCDTFVKPRLLKAHLKTVHEKLSNACFNCRKQISWGTMKQHLERCTVFKPERKFDCLIDGCTKAFYLEQDLKKHIKRKHEEI